MIFENIKPFIRHTELIKPSRPTPEKSLKSYDNCFLYTLSGNGSVRVDDVSYEMSGGSVLMWRAGQKYRICNSDNDLRYVIINFDFTGEKSMTNCFKITPEPPALFNNDRITDQTVFEDCPEFNSVIYKKSARQLEELVLGIVSEFKQPKSHMNMRASAKMIIVLSELSDSYTPETAHRTTDKADQILAYIHEHYTKEITNSDIARFFSFHPQHINKIVKAKTGYSLHKYVIMRRISKAIDLLENTGMPVAEISERTGFQNVCHFSRYFKDFMGASPRSYRQKTRPSHQQ